MTAGVLPPPGEPPRLTRGDLAQVFVRSFFFQSLWSYQRMQNVGWLFSLWPVLRRLNPSPEDRAKAAMSHGDYFNTHPYTADVILGVVAGLEEESAAKPLFAREKILAAKKAMSGPLSALGETVFWATARPLFLVAAAATAGLWDRGGWWLAPLLYLFLYNAFHVAVKSVGLWWGYRKKLEVAAAMALWPFQSWVRSAVWAGLGLSAGVLFLALFRGGAPWQEAVVTAAVVLFILHRGWSSAWGLYAALAVGLAAVF